MEGGRYPNLGSGLFCTNMNRRNRKMNIVLLSGGSGQRLWPLSNDIRSEACTWMQRPERRSL